MIRKALLPALAIAMLSGCATDYSYRNGNGNGDYYYGRPQVEYRQIGGYGGYDGYGGQGGYGGFGGSIGYGGYGGYGSYGYGLGSNRPVYYYDRFGRLIYGYPYSSYGYGAPYPNQYWRYQPRVIHHHHHGNNGNNGNNGSDDDTRAGGDRRPPWRNLRGMPPGSPVVGVDAGGEDRARPSSPFVQMEPRPTVTTRSSGFDDTGPVTGARADARSPRLRTNPEVVGDVE